MSGSTSCGASAGRRQSARSSSEAAISAAGYFGAGWSLGTLLLLYWLETILVTLVVSVLILLHRRTRTRKTTFLSSFLGVMVPFTLGHGVFVLVFAFLVFPQEIGPEARVSSQALADGMIGISAFLLASFLLDLPGLGERPFSWVEGLAGRAQGRMIVTHLTIIFGAAAMGMFETPGAFLGVFVVLKALLDLGGVLPDKKPKPAPPRVTKTPKEGKSFGEALREKIAADQARSKAKEGVVPKPGAGAG